MKKYIILIISAIPFAQLNAQVFKFRAVQFICTKYQNQPMEPPEFKDLKNMPVEFDNDSSILYIHSPSEQIFRLNKKPIDAFEKDSIAIYRFNATDQKGSKCIVSHRIYESASAPHFAAFVLEYTDKIFWYYVEKL
jgi:hypothetical protein